MNNQESEKTKVKNKKTAYITSGRIFRIFYFAIPITFLYFSIIPISGCTFSYRFNDVSFPDSIKTVNVKIIQNRAQYVNTQLAPRLTDKLRQKFVSQTKLSQTNNDNADWIIDGTITTYSFSTSGISQGREATNRLTVGVHITLNDQKANKTQEYDVSRNFEFSASTSIQQAEASLTDEIIRGLTDDIFNRLFSTW